MIASTRYYLVVAAVQRQSGFALGLKGWGDLFPATILVQAPAQLRWEYCFREPFGRLNRSFLGGWR